MAAPDKRFSVAGWILLGYTLSSYIVWGIMIARAPVPHGGSGPMAVAWLIAPVMPFQLLSNPITRETVQLMLWLLAAFVGCLAVLYLWRGVSTKKRFLGYDERSVE
jgi:hypothetical protein